MEIINRPSGKFLVAKNIYIGALLIIVGIIWLLYNFDIIGYRFFDIFSSWQMLLIAIGGYLLALKQWVSGGIAASLGLIFMLTEYFSLHIPIVKVILPTIVIAVGIVFLLQRKS